MKLQLALPAAEMGLQQLGSRKFCLPYTTDQRCDCRGAGSFTIQPCLWRVHGSTALPVNYGTLEVQTGLETWVVDVYLWARV